MIANEETRSGASSTAEKASIERSKKILFLTSSEYGQANVILAVAYEFLLLQQYEIHIASFAPLAKRIPDLNRLASPSNGKPAVFHTVAGPSAMESLLAKDEYIGPFRPGIRGAVDTYRITLPAMATTWDGPGYMVGYESCLEIIRDVDADLLVIDPLMSQGLEACNVLSRNCVVLSPNTFKDILAKQQPVFHNLCRIPAVASAFPYPVPWYLIPANIYLKFQLIWIVITNPKLKDLMNYRTSQKLPKLPPPFNIWREENHYLVPAIPETDFPIHITPNVTGCGPILLPEAPVSKTDPELQAWLEQGPTILINLGSHIRMDDGMAHEFATALRIVLDSKPNLQVLWKLKTSGGLAIKDERKSAEVLSKSDSKSGFSGGGLAPATLDPIEKELANGRVKVAEWLSADPLAILQTGHVVCSVHHGGSNSFHEALSAAVPQVILPCWLDTFDFANRVEWLGIGVYGSRAAAPSVEAGELSRALMRVLGDGAEAMMMKEKAKELAKISGKVGGRKKACEKIIQILEASK